MSDRPDTGALRWYLRKNKEQMLDPWNYVAVIIFIIGYSAGASYDKTYFTGILVGMTVMFVNLMLPRRTKSTTNTEE